MGDGQSYYSNGPYSPSYYSYPAGIPGPCYDPRSTAPSEVGSSPSYPSGYYGYSPYHYPPSPYWTVPSQAVDHHSSPITYHPPGQVNINTEDRSATPTPEDQVSTAETSVEAPVETQWSRCSHRTVWFAPLACYTHLLSSLRNVRLSFLSENANVPLICTIVHRFSSHVVDFLLSDQTCTSPCFAVIFLAHMFGKGDIG